MTIHELTDAVDRDKRNHLTKQLAELLLIAMNDWPTTNQIEIDDFVLELKDYFGTPLTIEKINTKPISLLELNTWKHEAGSSIVEMIDRSARFDNESDFDRIMMRILSYYDSSAQRNR